MKLGGQGGGDGVVDIVVLQEWPEFVMVIHPKLCVGLKQIFSFQNNDALSDPVTRRRGS